MSQYYPPPPGVDGRQSSASRYGRPPAPPAYRQPPPPPSFGAPPPPPPQHSNYFSNHDSYASNRYGHRSDGRDRDRGADWSRSDRSDRYARNDNDRDSRSYRNNNNNNYQDSYRPRGDSFRPPQSEFTFRADKSLAVGDSYRPSNNSRHADQNASRAPPRGPGRGRGGRFTFPRRGTSAWKPFKPSERALLQNNPGGQTTEDFADEENGPAFRPLDQLSDSEEAEKDMSDSDNRSGEPTAKRARTATKPNDGDSAPKWSNPDPYTALPPVEDADKKKRDMVQMIRKARVETSGVRAALAAPAADQDFLRFESDSDDADDDDSEDFIDPLTYNRSQASAPAAQDELGSGQVAPQVVAQHATNGQGKEQKIVIDLTQSPNKAAANSRAVAPVDLIPSTDLGTRKRTHDDELKLPAHAQLKEANKRPPRGNLSSEWRAKNKEPNCPWVQIPTSQAHINVRFHMEVADFYEHVKPRQFEARLRAKLVDDLNFVVSHRLAQYKSDRAQWKDFQMYPFGSYMSGLYLPTGDMDLAFCSRSYVNGGPRRAPSNSAMRRLADFIIAERLAVGDKVETILKSKVPILKYVDNATGLKVDISFENNSGIVAINTFKAWKEQWPVMPILATIIKQFLLMRELNEPVNGGLGGFSVICMVVSMLQNMPPIQSGDMDQRHDLGSLLIHFFDLYGNRFNHETVALSTNPPGYIAKSQVRDFVYNAGSYEKISIIDPNNPSNDIAGGSHNYRQIMACFSKAHRDLQERLRRIAAGEKFDSILEVVLGGNYSSFREQRNYLRKLHEQIHGHCDE